MSNLFIILSLVFALNSPLQTYHVKDSETKESLCGVKITINNNDYYTDINGEVTAEPNQKMCLSLISYNDTTLNGDAPIIYLNPATP